MNIKLHKLIDKQDLTLEESCVLADEMLQGNLSPAQIAAVLTAFRMKGEAVEEIVGFIQIMRNRMIAVDKAEGVVDICGTGGDGKGTFNISTASAFVVAGAGIPVAKHGNRAASSRCGSADVLEALGVVLPANSQQASMLLTKTGFTFLFAPFFHLAMKHVAPIRKELKIRTIFNILGPFISPAEVRRQVIGVPTKEITEKLSQVAINLQYDHLLIVTSEDGLDEISLSGKTHIFEIKKSQVKRFTIDPEDFGIKRVHNRRIKGGNAKENAQIIKRILNGEKGPCRDIVILNGAAGLYVSGKVRSIKEGLAIARYSLDSGKAKNILEKVIQSSIK